MNWTAYYIGCAVIGGLIGFFLLPSPARCEDRVVIKDNYGRTVGSITRDPVERDRQIIRDEDGKRIGSYKQERSKAR